MLVKYATRHAKHEYQTYAWVYLINPAIIGRPGHVVKPSRATPIARRSEDARRQSAGVTRFFFANNSSSSPAEDALGLVSLTGGRRAVLPSMHGRSFTAPLNREALRAERRAAAERAVQGVLKVAFCSFLDQLPPRLPPRPSTNPTFTSFLTQTPIMLTKELLQLPDTPSLLAQRCKLWRELPEHHHVRFVTVCGLRMVCIPTISYLHCQNKQQSLHKKRAEYHLQA